MLASLSGFAAALITPPASLFVSGLLGLVLARRHKRLGLSLTAGSFALLYLLTCPWVAGALLGLLQSSAPLPAAGAERALPDGPQAIVVLAAGWNRAAPQYGGSDLDRLTHERMRYAAELARRSGLPVVTSGGAPERNQPSLAEMMAVAMQRDYGVPVRFTERFSGNTRGNARGSADVLFAAGIEQVYLVTHGWHMPRAAAEFRRAGVRVVAAPTGLRAMSRLEPRSFWPSARALRESTWAFHELVGMLWYAVSG